MPVGKDQLPHIKITRAIARRFNRRYGDTFPIPETLRERAITVPGLDGTEKMGKSKGNTILLTDSPDTIRSKIAVAVTDTNRKRRQDPGNPFICNLYTLHEFVSPESLLAEIKDGCSSAGIGCLECKARLSDGVVALLGPFQERRAQLASNPNYVKEVLHEGGLRARQNSQITIAEVREKMGLQRF